MLPRARPEILNTVQIQGPCVRLEICQPSSVSWVPLGWLRPCTSRPTQKAGTTGKVPELASARKSLLKKCVLGSCLYSWPVLLLCVSQEKEYRHSIASMFSPKDGATYVAEVEKQTSKTRYQAQYGLHTLY